MGQLYYFQQFGYFGFNCCCIGVFVVWQYGQVKGDVIEYCYMVEQCIVLENEVYFMVVSVYLIDVGIVEVDMIVGLMFQIGDNLQQGGFFGV